MHSSSESDELPVRGILLYELEFKQQKAKIKPRFTAEQLNELEKSGQFVWRQYKMADGTERPYIVTRESLDHRHSTDMRATVNSIISASSPKLRIIIVHGTADTVVPVQDALEYHQLFGGKVDCKLNLIELVDHFYTVDQLRGLLVEFTVAHISIG